MVIKHNWAPTHSYPQGCGYSKVYEHQVTLECDGVNYQSMQWAAEHCNRRWGWYFTVLTTNYEKHAVMTFEDPEEMMLWVLRWQAEHRRK